MHAKDLSDRVRKGEFGVPYTSDYVFDEAITTTLVRTGRIDLAVKVGKIILGSREEAVPPVATLIRVDERVFAESWSSLKSGRYGELSFTDHTILAQLKESRINLLLSFDTGFDGLAARVQ